MLKDRYTKNPVTGGLDRRDASGAVVERLQPNRVTKGFDRYSGSRLLETIIPDGLGGFSVYRNGGLVGRR